MNQAAVKTGRYMNAVRERRRLEGERDAAKRRLERCYEEIDIARANCDQAYAEERDAADELLQYLVDQVD